MATVTKALYRGVGNTTTSTLLYTVPASTTTVVTNIVVVNPTGGSGTFTLFLDDQELHSGAAIAANSTVYIDCKQVLATTKTIKGGSTLGASAKFHISGVEIS